MVVTALCVVHAELLKRQTSKYNGLMQNFTALHTSVQVIVSTLDKDFAGLLHEVRITAVCVCVCLCVSVSVCVCVYVCAPCSTKSSLLSYSCRCSKIRKDASR